MYKLKSTSVRTKVAMMSLSLSMISSAAFGQRLTASTVETNALKLVHAYFISAEALLHAQKLQQMSSLDLDATERALTKLGTDSQTGLSQLQDEPVVAFAAVRVLADAALARSSLSRALLAAGGKLASVEAQAEYDLITAELAQVAAGQMP
ncbi:MAG: hypothetical protein NTZ90_09920 [Proteobacteria bacterium]|nr:hypothetical protein [Pseudomonadota bacterium]